MPSTQHTFAKETVEDLDLLAKVAPAKILNLDSSVAGLVGIKIQMVQGGLQSTDAPRNVRVNGRYSTPEQC